MLSAQDFSSPTHSYTRIMNRHTDTQRECVLTAQSQVQLKNSRASALEYLHMTGQCCNQSFYIASFIHYASLNFGIIHFISHSSIFGMKGTPSYAFAINVAIFIFYRMYQEGFIFFVFDDSTDSITRLFSLF